MIAEAIKVGSQFKGLVIDSFAGSGTILIRAEETDRRAAAIELTLGYVDVAVRRWEQYTGKTAVLGDDTGQTFERRSRRGGGVMNNSDKVQGSRRTDYAEPRHRPAFT